MKLRAFLAPSRASKSEVREPSDVLARSRNVPREHLVRGQAVDHLLQTQHRVGLCSLGKVGHPRDVLTLGLESIGQVQRATSRQE